MNRRHVGSRRCLTPLAGRHFPGTGQHPHTAPRRHTISVEAVRWALYLAPWLFTDKGHPDTTAHAVLVVLAEHADPAGRDVRPAPLRIRFATGFDVRTIDRALKRLDAAGLIEKDGRHYSGTQRWRLAMNEVRPASMWDDLVAEDEKARQVESDARQNRRRKEKARLSGAQSAGHIEIRGSMAGPVRDAECRTPGSSAPDAWPQSAGRRDFKPGSRDAAPPEPPEPSLNHPLNHPGTTPGGTLPPDPLRPPSPSAPGNEQGSSPSQPLTQTQDQQGESLPRNAGSATPPATPSKPSTPRCRSDPACGPRSGRDR